MISPAQIKKGNMFIARFEGMFYRNDWSKYPQGYWVLSHPHFRTLPISQLETSDIKYIGITFDYHNSWTALIEAWLQFQQRYKKSYPGNNMLDNEHFKEFAAGIANDSKLQSWKALAKACYHYLTIFNI